MNLRFALFMVVSLLAHASLLLHGDDREALQLSIGGHPPVLQISLQADRPAPAAESPAPARKPPPPVVTARRSEAAPRPQRAAPRQAAAPAVERRPAPKTHRPATVATATAEQPASPANAGRRISAALRQQLARYFSYPGLARKRGWQGEVMLSMRVESDGALSEVHIARSSGYPVLDRSALRSARRIGQLPDIAGQLQGQTLDLQIPVRFRLLDS